jgi:chitinase
MNDGEIEQGFKNDIENFKILNQTRKRNPYLKILISVGGWTWSGGFSDMCLTKESRGKFIRSAISFISENNLDGVDIDWEYPGLPGNNNTHRPEDKENFTSLLKEMRNALDELGANSGKHYLLTAATGASDNYLANTEMGLDQRYVDFFNLMTYDFSVPGADSLAGHNAPLFTNPRDPNHSSADAIVQKYIEAGVSPDKIVLGVPFYGHVWQVDSTVYHGLYEPGGVPKTRIRGSFANIENNLLDRNGFVRYWDSTSCAPYIFNDSSRIFITYDDVESLRDKCNYIKAHELKGAMFWSYSPNYYQLRLLHTLYDGLKESCH